MARKLTTRDSAGIAECLRKGERFDTHGSLSGGPSVCGSGRLTGAERALFESDDVRYVVRSYATPIAWQRADGSWYVVGQRFSVTTSKHQSKVATAIYFAERAVA